MPVFNLQPPSIIQLAIVLEAGGEWVDDSYFSIG